VNGRRPARIRVADMTVIALVGVMILLGKTVLRMPIHVPGHSGVLWIAALIIGCGVVRRRGSATLMALVGGVLVALVQPSSAGFLFAVAKYVVPGIVLDLVAPLFGGRLDGIAPAIFAGAAAHASKGVVDLLQGLVTGIPVSMLAVGLTATTAFNIAFGALGGLIGAIVLRTLIRARIPQLADLETASEEAP